jgi:hypothetical protein
MPWAEKHAFSASAVSESPGLSIHRLAVPYVFAAQAISLACAPARSDERREP